jgi:NADPH-dependent glutamate synthase beta subunit-like oxidoreductase
VIDHEINNILALGVKLHTNTCIGKNISFDELYARFDALFISTGLFETYRIGIDGDELPGVITGLEVLDDVTNGKIPQLGKKVLVIAVVM